MNNVNDRNFQICSGCNACIHSCPNKALSIEKVMGFYRVKIDDNKCVSCGVCKKVCYRFKNELAGRRKSIINCAKHKDKKILQKSSSGGISYALMQELIKQNYIVFGFAYDKQRNRCLIKKAMNIEECEAFFGSKYFQPNIAENNMLEEVLKEDKDAKLAFFGTPCFIAGIKSLLDYKGYINYILIDLFCHGIASDILWEKYYKQYISKPKEIDSVDFRSKKYGWHSFNNIIRSNNCFSFSKRNDKFYDLYFSGYFLNDSCASCQIKKDFSISDIRLGDAWGYTYDKDKEGVSLVFINSAKGQNMVNFIKPYVDFLQPVTFNEASLFQSTFNSNECIDLNIRTNLINELISDYSFKKIYKSYLYHLTIKKRLFLRLRHLFNYLPFFIKQNLRYYSHKKHCKL